MPLKRFSKAAPTGLRKRLVLLVLASVLPFLLLIGMVARRHLVDQKPEAAARAFAHAQHTAYHLENRLSRIEAVTRSLAISVSAAPANRSANDRILGEAAATFGTGFASWTLLDAQGAQVGASNSADETLETNFMRSLWSDATIGRAMVLEPARTGSAGYVANMILPMRDERGDSAFLVARIPLSSLQSLLTTHGLAEGSVVVVLSERGAVVARVPDPQSWVGKDLATTRYFQAARDQRSGTMENRTADGVERTMAFTRLRSAPWVVFAGIPMSAVFATARFDFARAVGYGALALTLGLLLAMWQASRIIQPLTRLSEDAAKLGTGNLSHRSGIVGTDELGTLAHTINEMATTLEQQGAVLRESEQRYRGLFDINPLPMWVLDPETLMFLAVNRAAIDAYGYSEQEFLSMKSTEIRPPEDVPALIRHMAETKLHARRFLTRHRRRDGTIFHVEIDAGAIVFGGRPARLVVAHDVSERMRAEEALRDAEVQLRQSQRLEAIGQLTGGIAHDFNNVLTAIGSYSDFLYDSLEAGDARRLDIQEIRKAADRAAGLTKQLLAFSRSQILQPKVIAVNDALRELETFLTRLLTADIRLEMRLDPDAGNVRVDPGQMAQVVINLAVNARDAMPGGGVLTIASRNEQIGDEGASRDAAREIKPGEYVVVDITDTGVGIDAETLQRIFEPFFTTKGPGKGTGLGLSTVYGIVHQSEGDIAAKSEVGTGTTFTICLPRVHLPVDAEQPTPDKADAGSRSETILVVEDEEAVRRAASRILAKKGYSVLEAGDGNQAMEIIRSQQKIDLVLTDLVMPGMGGRELVRVLREEGNSVRILYMSGYTKDAVMRAELDPEIMVLEKPFSHDELAAKVRAVLDR